jgi:hypothetical protein
VTTTAVSTEFTVMDIVCPVATYATTVNALHFRKCASVTVIAGDGAVCALEEKIRL